MTRVTCDMTVSLDGYSADNRDPDDSFLRIMRWAHDTRSFQERVGMPVTTPEYTADDALLAEVHENAGAYVMGRGMFDSGEIPWGDEPPFHAPVFVVTTRHREPLERIGTTFHFVDDVPKAVELARTAAGERTVAISGGANVVQQALRAGLIDELQLHIAPVLLGTGKRLLADTGRIELDPVRVTASPQATHVRYAVRSAK